MEKDDTFLTLHIPKKQGVKIPNDLKSVLRVFNEQVLHLSMHPFDCLISIPQYVPICTAILRDSTPIANFLIQMDKKIAEEAKPLIIKAKHRNQAEKTLDILDNNRGKILFYQSQNEDLSNQVKSAENKIRISLIW